MPEDSEATATTAPAKTPSPEESPPQATESEPEVPREQIPNISVDVEEEADVRRPMVSDPLGNMVDDATLALNQARMVANTGEAGPEGKGILLATPWQMDVFKSGDESFPDITSEGTWVTEAEAEAAELAAHRSGAKLYRKEG
jgi:hypothetical protein